MSEVDPIARLRERLPLALAYTNGIVVESDGYPMEHSANAVRTLLMNAFLAGIDAADALRVGPAPEFVEGGKCPCSADVKFAPGIGPFCTRTGMDAPCATARVGPSDPPVVPSEPPDPTTLAAKVRLVFDRFRALGGIPEACDLAWKLCNENEELRAEIERLRAGRVLPAAPPAVVFTDGEPVQDAVDAPMPSCINCMDFDGTFETEDVGPFCGQCWDLLNEQLKAGGVLPAAGRDHE